MTATRLIAYTPNGASLGPLPTPDDVNVGYPLNDVGALTFAYAPGAPRVDLLGQPLELAVEVSWDKGATWQEPKSSRFLYLRDGRDPIRTGDSWAVECAAYVIRLQKALVGFTGLNAEGVRAFTSATPGAILATLWDEAVARGALVGMSRSWSATQDSAGTPWPAGSLNVSYEPGKDLLSILQEFVDQGLVDYRTDGRTVEMFIQENTAGMGADRTLGTSPVTLRFGRDLTEAPFRRTWEGLADTALVSGDDGTSLERTNVSAVKPWGRQETFITASGVKDSGTLQVIADATLELSAEARTEHTFGLEFSASPHMPFRDYAPGEWVWAATSGGDAPQRFRVRQVTLTREPNGNASGNVVLNDRFLEADVATARRIQRITQGATLGGTGTSPGSSAPGAGPDILAPAQVLGLTSSSTAYTRQDGLIQAQVSLGWSAVTTNADGTTATDIDHYEVWGRKVGSSAWALLADVTTNSWTNSPYDPGQVWEFQVRAVDTVFNRGAFSSVKSQTMASDTTPPTKPSKPTGATRMGTARITWDGKSSTGGTMDSDFTHVQVHVSQVNNFTPTAATQVNELGKGGGYVTVGPLDYNATYYARLVAVDTSGNTSTASDVLTLQVLPLVDVSNFPDDAMNTLYARTAHFIDVTTDMLQANIVTAAKIAGGAVEAQHLTVGAQGISVIRNSWFEDAGRDASGNATTSPAAWRIIYTNGTAATLGFSPTPISGSRSLRITAPATNTDATVGMDNLIDGKWLPVVPGQKWYLRATFKPAQAVPSGKKLHLRFHTSTPATTPYAIFDANATWHTVSTTTSLTAGQVVTLEQVVTVPANHTLAGVSVAHDAMGFAPFHLDVDSVEVFPAATDSQITEVGAGKIKTGVLQATERVVAGGLTGARAELNGLGFQAFDANNVKTFEVLGSSGSVYTAGTFTTKAGAGSGRVEISALSNPYQTGQTWASLAFYSNNSAWDPALLWAVYGTDTGPLNWGVLSIRGPRLGTRTPAAIDMRSEEQTNATSIDLRVQTLKTEAKVHELGDDGAGRVVIRQRYSGGFQGFSFQSPGQKRLNIDLDTLGTSIIQAKDENNAQAKLALDGSTIEFVPQGTGNMIVSPDNAGNPWFGRSNLKSGIRFNNGTETGSREWSGTLIDHKAAAHTTGSDAAWKDDQQALAESVAARHVLEVLNAKSWTWVAENAPRIGKRGLGFIAQEVQEAIPEAVTGVAVSEGGEGLAIDLVPLVAVLWAACQELDREVRTMKAS